MYTDAIAVLKSAAIQTEYNSNAWMTLVHAAQHLDANAKPERKTECVTTATPWGKADMVTRYARGINFYSTPGHGGFHLSANMNKRVPVELRQQSFAGLGMKGWYEEDCDAYIVIVAFSEYFTPEEVESARVALANYLPVSETLRNNDAIQLDEELLANEAQLDPAYDEALSKEAGISHMTIAQRQRWWNGK